MPTYTLWTASTRPPCCPRLVRWYLLRGMKLGRTRSNCTFENDFVFVLFKARRNRPVKKKHQKRPGMTICALSNTSCQLVRGSAAQKLSGVFHSGNKNHRAQGHVPVRTRLKIFHDVLKKYLIIFEL